MGALHHPRPSPAALLVLAAVLCIGAAAAAAPIAGAPITLQPCSSSNVDQAFVVAANAITSLDGSLCVTDGGGSPAPLTMQACDGGVAQQMVVDGSDGSIRMPSLAGGCKAWNQQTDKGFVSSYTCSSIAWNGVFAVGAFWAHSISANFSDPATPSPATGLCATAAPQPPPRPCPAASCVDDIDCNLNGECSAAGACVCYKPWGGVTCGELQFLPLQAPAGTNGMPGATPNETTWGGNAIFFEGQYHLFVAEMVNNCSLAQWGSNSRCAHAVSSTPEGPYTRVDVAVDVWCHNRALLGGVARP